MKAFTTQLCISDSSTVRRCISGVAFYCGRGKTKAFGSDADTHGPFMIVSS